MNADDVAIVVRRALKAEFGDNADPYIDDPYRFGVCFEDGSMVDVFVGGVPAAAPPEEPWPTECPSCGSDSPFRELKPCGMDAYDSDPWHYDSRTFGRSKCPTCGRAGRGFVRADGSRTNPCDHPFHSVPAAAPEPVTYENFEYTPGHSVEEGKE